MVSDETEERDAWRLVVPGSRWVPGGGSALIESVRFLSSRSPSWTNGELQDFYDALATLPKLAKIGTAARCNTPGIDGWRRRLLFSLFNAFQVKIPTIPRYSRDSHSTTPAPQHVNWPRWSSRSRLAHVSHSRPCDRMKICLLSPDNAPGWGRWDELSNQNSTSHKH